MLQDDEKEPWRSKERSTDPIEAGWVDGPPNDLVAISHHRHPMWMHPRPSTEFEALMVCAPGQEPVLPDSETLDKLMDALQELSTEDRFIIDRIVFERMTVRGVASELGIAKSYLHRKYRRALDRLRAALDA